MKISKIQQLNFNSINLFNYIINIFNFFFFFFQSNLKNNKSLLKKIAIILRDDYRLSYNKIATELNIYKGTLFKICKQ